MNNCQHTRTAGHPQDNARTCLDCGADVAPIPLALIPDLPEGGERTFPTGTDMRTAEEISDHIKAENALACRSTVSTGDNLSTHLPESEGGEL